MEDLRTQLSDAGCILEGDYFFPLKKKGLVSKKYINEGVETWNTLESTPPGWGELPLVTDIGHPEHFEDYPGPKIELLVA